MTARRPRLPRRYAKPALIAHGGMGDVYEATDRLSTAPLRSRCSASATRRRRVPRPLPARGEHRREPLRRALRDRDPRRRRERRTACRSSSWSTPPRGTVAERLARRAGRAGLALAWLEQAADGARSRAHARDRSPRRQARQPVARRRRQSSRLRLRDRAGRRTRHVDGDRHSARVVRLHGARAGTRRGKHRRRPTATRSPASPSSS